MLLSDSHNFINLQGMSKHLAVGLSVGAAVPLLISFLKSLSNQQGVKKQLDKRKFVGIQLGGTNYNVAIGDAILNNKGEITDFVIMKRKNGITYADPQQTLRQIINFIHQNQAQSNIETSNQQAHKNLFIGIASFGPLCLDPTNPLYGSITTTPKQLWRGVKVLEILSQVFPAVPIRIDTDVNAAAMAQFKLGKHQIKQSLVYITIGTGVGVGVIVNGKPIHGLTHPQGGHIIVERSPDEFQNFLGVCPYHKNQTCLQGMVCNKSIAERLQISFTALADIPNHSKVWRLIAFYLAQLCLSVTLLLSPEVIVIGGGIMNRKLLFELIKEEFIAFLGGYVDHPLLTKQKISQYIVPPKLGGDVGVKGAMVLSQISD